MGAYMSAEEPETAWNTLRGEVIKLGQDYELEFGMPEIGENQNYIRCKKNPGHTNMRLVKDVTLEDLPDAWRYPDLFDLLMKAARLVVKINVPYVSPNRPEKYACGMFRGMWIPSVGTGLFNQTSELRNQPLIDCPLKQCRIPKPHQTTPVFTVETAKHVVFDDLEAEHITVQFFFDSEENFDAHVVTGQGVGVLRSIKDSDWSTVLCVSHDLDLFKKCQILPPYPSLKCVQTAKMDPLPDDKPKEPLIVTISHPHGHIKHMSFGTWVSYKRKHEKTHKNVKVTEWVTAIEKLFPSWRETGVNVDDVFLSVQHIQEMKEKAEMYPDSTLEDWSLKDGSDTKNELKFITYNTATCPGSSGAPVWLFIQGQDGVPYSFAGVTNHFRHFKGVLNAGGTVALNSKHREIIKQAISSRKEIVKK